MPTNATRFDLNKLLVNFVALQWHFDWHPYAFVPFLYRTFCVSTFALPFQNSQFNSIKTRLETIDHRIIRPKFFLDNFIKFLLVRD